MRILTFVLSLILALPVMANEMRTVSGSVAYRERMALPPDATLMVEATGFRDISLGMESFEADGQQVPWPFALDIPAGVAATLQAGILLDGTMHWISEPVRIAAGNDNADIGLVQLSAFEPSAFESTLDCGAAGRFTVGFDESGAVVQSDYYVYHLGQIDVEGEARFESADGRSLLVGEDDGATLVLDGEALPGCVFVSSGSNDRWSAQGNEPGWRIVFNQGRMALDLNYGDDRLDLRLPEAEIVDGGYVYAFDDFALTLTVRDKICQDDMSGVPFPQSVELKTASATLKGCGGETLSLIDGPPWTVEAVNGEPVADEAELTLMIGADGNISGSAGCNHYMGRFAVGGEGQLEIGPLASTQMACSETLMSDEAAFLKALDGAERFEIDGSGKLILLTGTEAVITAVR